VFIKLFQNSKLQILVVVVHEKLNQASLKMLRFLPPTVMGQHEHFHSYMTYETKTTSQDKLQHSNTIFYAKRVFRDYFKIRF